MADKRLAVVTGAARGIGRAIVFELLKQGRIVAALDIIADQLQDLENAAKDAGFDVLTRCVDITDTPKLTEVLEQLASEHGGIDVLVNNAGIFEAAAVDAPAAAWREAWARVLQVNLVAPAELCREAILHFRRHGGGRIINVASRAAFRGEAPDQMPYGASKGALVTLTKTIARGFAAEGILAFCIAPGFTETEMVTRSLDPKAVQRVVDEIPLGAMAPPEEIGALAAFLCADGVRHLTGATFDVNGASYVR